MLFQSIKLINRRHKSRALPAQPGHTVLCVHIHHRFYSQICISQTPRSSTPAAGSGIEPSAAFTPKCDRTRRSHKGCGCAAAAAARAGVASTSLGAWKCLQRARVNNFQEAVKPRCLREKKNNQLELEMSYSPQVCAGLVTSHTACHQHVATRFYS